MKHCLCFFFFFQAEDGIRDLTVTGVQTCALPIYRQRAGDDPRPRNGAQGAGRDQCVRAGDRKSTRLNSSHSQISYAVFCLKKKKKEEALTTVVTTKKSLTATT